MAPAQRDNLFLVAGHPKSGTTFLQRMLNLHPEVSCPSEQHLQSIRQGLVALLDRYQEIIDDLDRSANGPGAPRIRLGTRSRVFRDVALRLSVDFADGKPIHGLNENEAFFDLARHDQQFKRPRIILVFRNPVDIALSSWRHNHRAARLEPDLAEGHLANLHNPEGTLEGYVKVVVDGYVSRTSELLAYASAHDNVLPVRYEALAGRKAEELGRILRALDADAGEAVVGEIVASSSRESMAKASRFPGFFGVGPDAEPPVQVADAFRRAMQDRWLTPEMRAIGYGDGCGQSPHPGALRPMGAA